MRSYQINWNNITDTQRKKLQEQYLKSPLDFLDFTQQEAEEIQKKIITFYQQHLETTGLQGYVIGLSGGLDSSLAASLLVQAVGASRVYGVVLPSHYTQQEDLHDIENLVKMLDIQINRYENIAQYFSSALETLEKMGEKSDDHITQRLKNANMQARIRMIILRDIARSKNYLVAGTSNASERMTGYSTLAGDGLGGVDNEGLDQLFKTQEKKLAFHLGLPKNILQKDPSAGLWEGQTDEKELGMSYELLDQILIGYLLQLDKNHIVQAISSSSLTAEMVEGVFKKIEKNKFKSQLPQVCRLY